MGRAEVSPRPGRTRHGAGRILCESGRIMGQKKASRREPRATGTSARLGPLRVVEDREGVKLMAHGVLYAIHARRLERTPTPWLALAAAAWLPERPGPLRSVALLGYGGGTLARLLRAAEPGLRLHGVEPDPVVRRLAREHLAALGSGVRLFATDAETFLRAGGAAAPRYDAILDDIYAPADGHLSRPLGLEPLPGLARRRLTPGGVYAVSVRSPGGAVERSAVRAVQAAFRHVRAVYTGEWAHRIVVGSDAPLPAGGLGRALAALFGTPRATPGRLGLGPVRRLAGRGARVATAR